jgi:hypothetical protein
LRIMYWATRLSPSMSLRLMGLPLCSKRPVAHLLHGWRI